VLNLSNFTLKKNTAMISKTSGNQPNPTQHSIISQEWEQDQQDTAVNDQ
jgi:hypothetical protein